MTAQKPRKGVVVELVDGRRLHWPDACDYDVEEPGDLNVTGGPGAGSTVYATVGPGQWVTATVVTPGCWPTVLDGGEPR
jgi:hypothetical protein